MNGITDFMAISHHSSWPYLYSLSVVSAFILAWLLRKSVPNIVRFVWHMLVLTVLFLFTAYIAFVAGYETVSISLNSIGILIFGLLLIRQICLVILRLIIPRFGMYPPRILEEILVLLAFVVWVLILLTSAGLDLSSLVTSTAVITAVIAFAMQDTLGNILSGLALQLDRSVHIGDWIEVETTTDRLIQGRVVQVQWRHTEVLTLFGERVLVPNSTLMKSLVVLTGGPTVPARRRPVYFYCDYNLRPAKVIEAINYALQNASVDLIDQTNKPGCVIHDMANGVVTYALYYWLTDPRSPGLGDSLARQHIMAVFERNQWQFAAPGMDLGIYSSRHKHRLPQTDMAELDLRRDLLRANSLFSPLSDEEIAELSQQLQLQHFVAGSILAKQDEVGNCLFIVADGIASVWLEAPDGRHLLAELGAGQPIGEMSLMTGEPRRATVLAKTDMDCYMLDHAGFKKILQQRPELAAVFAELLAQRKNELASVADKLSQPAVQEEQAHLLQRIRQLFSK